jgi:anthranilate synthase/aminodeoxychorismate synthase-like glutamine amidotransferase|tara:strand:+ start:124 stop:702 length:579 start_codon:yes stop_codon:yes gene_type:complete
MIDNYDSFTFNLVHYFKALGQEVAVYRNDQITLTDIEQLAPKVIVISPGPGEPNDAGLSLSIIQKFLGVIPILGVCLGHQCIAQHFGAKIIKAKKLMHGKTSKIVHNNLGLFKALNNPLEVARYHSLIVDRSSLPDELEISAWSLDAKGNFEEIMALQHKTLAIASVQFHPEAILTEQGQRLLKNYLDQFIG